MLTSWAYKRNQLATRARFAIHRPTAGMTAHCDHAQSNGFAIDPQAMRYLCGRGRFALDLRPGFTIDPPRLTAPNIGLTNRKTNSGHGGWFEIDRLTMPLLLTGQKKAPAPKTTL